MRTTEKDILNVQDQLNSIIRHKGIEVRLGGRYGYQAFDLFRTKRKGGSCMQTIRAGMTKKEAYDYLWALLKGIELYTWKR